MEKHDKRAFMLVFILLLFTVSILGNIRPSHAATTKIIVDPTNNTFAVGEFFNINVTIVDVTNLYGFDIRFWWDSTVLEYQSKLVYIPRDTKPNGILWSPYVKPIDVASKTAGTYRLVAGSQNPAPSFNSTASDGQVFRLRFKVLREGATWLHFTSTELSDRSTPPRAIPHVAEDGHFTTNLLNKAPLANFTFSPDTIYVGRTNVAFDGSASYDPDGGALLKYMWDFGDTTKENTTIPTAYHTYSSEGFFTVTLRVLDEENSYSPPFPNQKPLSVAKFCDLAVTNVTVSPQELAQGLNATINTKFRNVGDTNVTAATMKAYYNKTAIDPGDLSATNWEQIANQTISLHPVLNPWKPGENVSWTFNWNTTGVSSKAYYWIMLNITYSLPSDHNAANNVKLSESSILIGLPIARFTFYPSLPEENQMITFNASTSYDPDGIITKYHWDFGDGNTKTYIQGINLTDTTTHQYSTSGSYLVNLTVTDDDGLSNSTTKEVHVAIPPPVALFEYDPVFPVEGEEVAFNATDSHSPKGFSITKYHWDFGDGSPSVEETDPIVTHRYLSAGTYKINLTVTDQIGLAGSLIKSVVIARGSIEVEADVGAIHFAGENVEFYVLIKFLGTPISATDPIDAKLYYSGSYLATLTAQPVTVGLYRVPYTIPGAAASGTYTLLVQAKYYSMKGSTMRSFLISATLTEENAWLKEIKGNVITIVTRTGEIQLDLAQINATLLSIKGTVGIINSTLGEIVVPDLTSINATLTDIIIDSKGEILAQIDYFLGSSGTITATLEYVYATVVSIEGDVMTIQTEIGTVKTNVADVQATTTTPLYVASAFSVASTIIAAIALVLLRKKST